MKRFLIATFLLAALASSTAFAKDRDDMGRRNDVRRPAVQQRYYRDGDRDRNDRYRSDRDDWRVNRRDPDDFYWGRRVFVHRYDPDRDHDFDRR
jgi:neutral trehalase